MKRRIFILSGFCFLFGAHQLQAQLANTGTQMVISQNALLYVNAPVVHKAGEILNNGEMLVTGNWDNASNNSVFNENSLGKVTFYANNLSFSGNGKTTFPRLVFKGSGVYNVKTRLEARISLDLEDSEVQATVPEALTLLNTDANSLYRNTGYINTSLGADGSFVRFIKSTDDYLYPLGSSQSKLMRFVYLRPKDASTNAVAVSFMHRDANVDGYSRNNKSADVAEINASYYHILKRLNGNSPFDASFLTATGDKFNSLVNWTNKNNWDKALPVTFQDLTAITAGQDKSFFHPGINLPLGMSIPFAFAEVTNLDPLEIYNAFSPDGDGKNDTWEIKNIDAYPDNDLKIFDRSGNLVYRMNNYSSSKFWDGQSTTSGTFIYILRVNINGTNKYYKGSITMVKN